MLLRESPDLLAARNIPFAHGLVVRTREKFRAVGIERNVAHGCGMTLKRPQLLPGR